MSIPLELERYLPLLKDFGHIAAGNTPHRIQNARDLEKLGLATVLQENPNVAELTPVGEQILVFFLECLKDAERVAVNVALHAATTALASIDDQKLD